MENPLAVANYFIKKSLENGKLLTNMKLVKLVYIAHGWYLGLTNEPLIAEGAEAWKYGPVIPTVYESFKIFGGNPVTQPAYTITDTGQVLYYTLSDPTLSEFLDRIWDVYHSYSGVQLSALTHQVNTPWHKAWHENNGKERRGAVIPNDSIKQHYKELAAFNMKENATV